MPSFMFSDIFQAVRYRMYEIFEGVLSHIFQGEA